MQTHFSNFTPEAMRALVQAFAAGAEQRLELVEKIRSETFDLLADSRRRLAEAEAERCQNAAHDADSRRLFVSELRSEVHALRNRFELARRDMATDLQQMGSELRAAREAFHNRSSHQAAPRRPARTPAHKSEPFEPERDGKEAPRARSAQGSKSTAAKKRHA